MISKLINSNLILIFLISLSITACGGKLPGADAKKVSPDPRERVKKNLEEGKGFRLNDLGKKNSGTTYEFASSNELWRASLDVIDFMPLTTANYNGGIIVTDWYSENQKAGESVKITIRFLTNEVRSDALNVKVFYKKCKTVLDCEITETEGNIKEELTKSILKKATIYKKQSDKKNFKKRPDIKD
jgi:predicted small lipoprotein YifL